MMLENFQAFVLLIVSCSKMENVNGCGGRGATTLTVAGANAFVQSAAIIKRYFLLFFFFVAVS